MTKIPDPILRNSDTYGTFKKHHTKVAMNGSKRHNPHGIKFLTRFRLGHNHLREDKFKHSFKGSLNP